MISVIAMPELSASVELDLTCRKFVYRLWADDDSCLYVGQHTGFHPACRIRSHRSRVWWDEVCRADYVEVTGNLGQAEQEQILLHEPKHNGRMLDEPGYLTRHSFAMPSDEWERFGQKADGLDVTRSQVLRELIHWWSNLESADRGLRIRYQNNEVKDLEHEPTR